MALYNIYYGLGGGFGGASLGDRGVEFDTEEEALQYAYQCAVEEYESYEGLYGLASRGNVVDEYCEENGIDEEDLTEEDQTIIDENYEQEYEGWLDYYVRESATDKEADLYD